MDSVSTNSSWNLEKLFHSFLHASVFHDPKWITKFTVAFIPAFLTTGLLFGVMYVLIMRAIHANRKAVEAWFEQQRLRLQAGPVPVIEKAQPVMLAGLFAIYGRTALRRLASSFCIGAFFTAVIFAVVYSHYSFLSGSLQEKKVLLERAADPQFYDIATNPTHKKEYDDAFKMIMRPMGEATSYEYLYSGTNYDNIRALHDKYPARLAAQLSANPDQVELTLLFLMQGSYINPGFHWADSILLFFFNVLLDFTSVTMVIICLRKLGLKLCFPNAVYMFCCAIGCTLLCFTVAFLSYRLFFHGNTGFFLQVLLIFPLSLLAVFGGLSAILSSFFGGDKNREPGPFYSVLIGGLFTYLGVTGLSYVWSFWSTMSLGGIHPHDLFSFPYILAATTLVPSTITIMAFGLMLVAKITAEPARVLPEAYMTFVKEEVGGTQVSGIILILGTIAGVIAGLIWA